LANARLQFLAPFFALSCDRIPVDAACRHWITGPGSPAQAAARRCGVPRLSAIDSGVSLIWFEAPQQRMAIWSEAMEDRLVPGYLIVNSFIVYLWGTDEYAQLIHGNLAFSA
jgi:hypothetical protein